MTNCRYFSSRILFINILIGGLLACSAPKEESGSGGSAHSAAFRVALLTPGPITDRSWNGGAYEGLMQIRDSLRASISHIQTKTPAEFEENFRQYGADGYSLVFGHGFEFQDAAARVAPSFPKTVFITTGGTRTSSNVAAMSFAFDEPSFLAGMVAASISKSGVIGCIGGTELPPVKAGFTAFARGVRAVDSRIRIITAYIGNWDDAGAGKEQALAQIAGGADVIYQNADAAGLGIFQAAKDSKGVYIIGSNANQNDVAPAVTLGSVVIDLPVAFLRVAREVKRGAFTPRVIVLDTKSGVMKWVLNPSARSLMPPRMLTTIDSVQRLMLNGSFTLPSAARAPEDR